MVCLGNERGLFLRKIIELGLKSRIERESFICPQSSEAIDWNYVHEYLEADEYDLGIHSLEWMEPILILNCMYDDPEYINGGDNDYQWFYEEVTKCASEPDDEVRSDMLGALEMKNHPEWNCIPIYSDISYVCFSSRVKGINILPNGFIYWNDLSL